MHGEAISGYTRCRPGSSDKSYGPRAGSGSNAQSCRVCSGRYARGCRPGSCGDARVCGAASSGDAKVRDGDTHEHGEGSSRYAHDAQPSSGRHTHGHGSTSSVHAQLWRADNSGDGQCHDRAGGISDPRGSWAASGGDAHVSGAGSGHACGSRTCLGSARFSRGPHEAH